MKHLYLIALGSNQRHPRLGSPRAVLHNAARLIAEDGAKVLALSRVIETRPIGPSLRRYANAVLLARSKRPPKAMLKHLLAIEAACGRRRMGQRWRSRVLDLDIVLWDGGIVAKPRLALPHPRFRERDFVLGPAAQIAPNWRDPVTNLSLAQLHARLTRPRALPR